jgi:hypothetical protein
MSSPATAPPAITDPNELGRASALTVVSTTKRRGLLPLRLLFFVGRLVPALLNTLRQLSFIHFARWTLIKKLPDREQPLKHTQLFFESNFNGTWNQYIDAFSYVVPKHIAAIWWSAYGFPGPLPAEPFKDYIASHEHPAAHYYSAYPEASVTMILGALEVRRDLDKLRRKAQSMSPEAFDEAYRAFLRDHQNHI